MKLTITTVSIIVVTTLQLLAQSSLQVQFFNALQNDDMGEAKKIMHMVKKQNPEGLHWKFLKGVLCITQNKSKQGLTLLEEVKQKNCNFSDGELNYWLGLGYYHQQEYTLAEENWTSFLGKLPKGMEVYKKEAEVLLAHLENARVMTNRMPDFSITNLGQEVNTRYFEHSPVFTETGTALFFTSTSPKEGKKKATSWRDMDENVMMSELDMDYRWKSAEKVDGMVNSDKHEGVIQLFDSDRKMLMFRNSRGGDIYISDRMGSYWSKPVPFKEINSNYSESHATVSKDGNMVVFSSNRNSNEGKFDLFFITKNDNGTWSKPKLLSEEINLKDYDEDYPFLSEDGKTLYFSSNGHRSIGGFDVFRSLWDESKQAWGTPQNLGRPVNSHRDDVFFTFNEKQGKGFLASNRPGGAGRTDIYVIEKTMETLIMGYIGFHMSAEELANHNTYIAFTNTETKETHRTQIDTEGFYQVPLAHSNQYKFEVLKKESGKMRSIHEQEVWIDKPKKSHTVIQDFYITSL